MKGCRNKLDFQKWAQKSKSDSFPVATYLYMWQLFLDLIFKKNLGTKGVLIFLRDCIRKIEGNVGGISSPFTRKQNRGHELEQQYTHAAYAKRANGEATITTIHKNE